MKPLPKISWMHWSSFITAGHTVLIGTVPSGKPEVSGEPLFIKTAMHPFNGLKDHTILFFEPA